MRIFTFIYILLFSLFNWNFSFGSNPITPNSVNTELEDNLMNIWYVNIDAPFGGSGTSWQDAFTDLQDALDIAADEDEIWVAQGTYYPSRDTLGLFGLGDPTNLTFSIRQGVKIYGGFNGTETSLSERDYEFNQTILDGDLLGFATVKSVIYFVAPPASEQSQKHIVIDGFEIKNSTSFDFFVSYQLGGVSLYTNYEDTFTINNCLFENHHHAEKGGAIYANAYKGSTGNVNVNNCVFFGNSTSEGGGAIYANQTNLTVNNCYFSNNNVYGDSSSFPDGIGGGGIAFEADKESNPMKKLILNNSIFDTNSSNFDSNFPETVGGGAIYFSSGRIEIDSCDFIGNGSKLGGALFLDLKTPGDASQTNNMTNVGGINLTNSKFDSNQAEQGGGIFIFYSESCNLNIENTNFTTNNGSRRGGGIYYFNSLVTCPLTLNNCNISDNTSNFGAGIYIRSGNIDINNSTLESNYANSTGGAIYVNQANVGNITLIDSHIKSNKGRAVTISSGGAISTRNGKVKAERTWFVENELEGVNTLGEGGGAIHCEGLELINCVFDKNRNIPSFSPFGVAGAVFARGLSVIINCTFYANIEPQLGVGTQLFFQDIAFIENSIIWESLTPNPIEGQDASIFVNNSLIEYGYSGINNISTDPQFFAPFSGELSLDICSPAINTGNTNVIFSITDVDIYGNPRIAGGRVDMGAIENQEAKASNHFFVATDGNDENRGVFWDCPFQTIERAIEVAKENDTIWVAAGLYKPGTDIFGNSNPVDNRNKTFYLNKNLKIYGGFEGNESPDTFDLADRDFDNNLTVLSGFIDSTANSGSYHVFYSEGLDSSAIIDGFYFVEGYADGTSLQSFGGGFFNINSSPKIQNCQFEMNHAEGQGGGLAILGNSEPLVQYCNFISNNTMSDGAGVYSEANPTFKNCFFENNYSNRNGGAMAIFGNDTPLIQDCTFQSNFSDEKGGAIYTEARPIVKNCDFAGNFATDGGAVHTARTDIFKACQFESNQATRGGAIFSSARSRLENCRFDNNSADKSGGDIYHTETIKIRNGLFTNSIAPEGGAIYFTSPSTFSQLDILNSTFSNITSGGNSAVIQMNDGIGKASITNSIIWGNNGISILFIDQNQVKINYNIIENGCNESGLSGCKGNNNWNVSPQFANDYSLMENSIGIDAGSNKHIDWADLLIDFNRIPRIVNGTVDLGAFEYCDPNAGMDCGMLFNSITEMSVDQKILLFPNPANDILNISFPQPTEETGSIELTSLTGEVLKTKPFSRGIDKMVFQVESFQPGYYFITIRTEAYNQSQGIVLY